MRATTEEVNLFRLLLGCEAKLNSQPIDTWTASEKRKFAAVRKSSPPKKKYTPLKPFIV